MKLKSFTATRPLHGLSVYSENSDIQCISYPVAGYPAVSPDTDTDSARISEYLSVSEFHYINFSKLF